MAAWGKEPAWCCRRRPARRAEIAVSVQCRVGALGRIRVCPMPHHRRARDVRMAHRRSGRRLSAFQSGIKCRSSRSNRSSGRGRRPAAWTGPRGRATPSGGRKMPETLVPERSIHKPNVVPEIPPALQPPKTWLSRALSNRPSLSAMRPTNFRAARSVTSVFGNASRLGQRRRCINPARDISKQVEIERGKQSLRRHEAISDRAMSRRCSIG